MNKKTKIESLQVLRAFAFLGVFSSHCGISELGQWGVSVFFVLSGFLMMYSYYDRDLATSLPGCIKFGIEKMKRLYPLHIITLLWSIFISFATITRSGNAIQYFKYIFSFLLNIFLLQAWVPNSDYYYSFNGVSWYLSVCLFIYAAFPLILKWFKKKATITDSFFLVLILFFAQYIAPFAITYRLFPAEMVEPLRKWLVYICPLFRCGDFAIGCCVGYWFLKGKSEIGVKIATLSEIIIITVIVFTHYMFHVSFSGFIGTACMGDNMIYTFSSLALVYFFALNRGIVSKMLTCKPFVFIGNISGYAFLVHTLVIICVRKIMGNNVNNYIIFIISLVITIIMGEMYSLAYKKLQIKNNRT